MQTEAEKITEGQEQAVITKLAEGGRIVIPAEFRQALGMKVGDVLILSLMKNGELIITTRRQAIKRAQELFRRYAPKNRDLLEELISDRRQEAENE
jgi:AbrB family looped-hinge helix DNA binding protein